MKRITLLLIAGILCCAACNNDFDIPAEPAEAAQQIQLFMSDAQEVSVYSAATVSECRIDTMWVCVFNKEDSTIRTIDDVKFIEMIKGDRIMNNGQATQLLPQLQHKIENGNIVACIANVGSNPDTANVLHLDSINNCFPIKTKAPLHYYQGGDYLPMYGEIAGWSSSGSYTCPMIRAVAKIQVQLGPSFSTVVSDFNADNVTYTVWWPTGSNFIQPKTTPNDVFLDATGTSWYTAESYLLQKKDATERQTNIFIHEFQFSSFARNRIAVDKKTNAGQRMHMLLIKGSGANRKNYRLDFYDHEKSEYMDILRNHHYLFTINRVGSDGYGSTWEAENYPGSNIEYTVIVDNDALSITSNGQMAVVTNVDTVRIPGDVTEQAVAKFRCVYPQGGTPIQSGWGAATLSDTIIVDTATILPKNPRADLIIISPKGGDAGTPIQPTYQDLVISTTGNLTEAVILFKYGNITHRLPIRKR